MTELTLITLNLILKEIEKTTAQFLDDDNITPLVNNPLTISYRGVSVEIPLDYAELNNEVQVALEDICEVMKCCI